MLTVLLLSAVIHAAHDPAVQHGILDYIKQVGELITALGVILGFLWWLVWPRVRDGIENIVVKVTETHRSVTVNHHSSPEPTMRDDVSDVKQHVAQLSADLGVVKEDLGTVREDQAALIHEAATATTIASEVRDRLDSNEESGQRYVDLVRGVLEQHGIDLPKYDRPRSDGD